MSLKLGNTNIGELYVGSTKIGSAYLGSTKVYEASAPGPSFDSVTIGTQTWMAKNLAIDDGGTGITIKENVTANGVNFGTQYYYNWNAAVRVANSIEGWHLPSVNEWTTLALTVGGIYFQDVGTKLKSTAGWNYGNGTDDYGFTGFPVGIIYSGSFLGLGQDIMFWTSNENSSNATYKELSPNSALYGDSIDKSMLYCSVRLVKDT